jgi:hypothetical protein
MAQSLAHNTLDTDFPPAALKALNQLLNPHEPGDHLEHKVASLATTLINHTFAQSDPSGNMWIYTPEQKDSITSKKPDYTVERLSNGYVTPYLCAEFKKRTEKDQTYSALKQLRETVSHKFKENFLNNDESVLTIYLLVFSGYRVSFWEMDFEAIHDREPEEPVHNLWGCRSLLQSPNNYGEELINQPPYGQLLNNIPPGVQRVAVEIPNANNPRSSEWNEALKYETPAVWDMSNYNHRLAIMQMLRHMASNRPRGF